MDEFKLYIESIEEEKQYIIGKNVHEYIVKNTKYPQTWIPFVKRYLNLIRNNKNLNYNFNRQIYVDILATIISRQIRIVDLPVIVGPAYYEFYTSEQYKNYKSIHVIVAKMTLFKLIKCSLDSILSVYNPKIDLLITEFVKNLYDNLIATLVDENITINEEDGHKEKRDRDIDVDAAVDGIIIRWLLNLFNTVDEKLLKYKPEMLSDAIPFVGVSHLYWFWLHITSTHISPISANDFITLVYKFDHLIYCGECSVNYKKHIVPFYYSSNDSIVTSYKPSDLVYHLHKVTNIYIGDDLESVTEDIIDDYRDFFIMN